MCSADSLPDHPALLKALVSAQQAEIEHLKFVIAQLRRMPFGRRSEPLDETITPLERALEEIEGGRAEWPCDEMATPEEAEPVSGSALTPLEKSTPKRKPLPAHLPRDTVEPLPAGCACPDCGGALRTCFESSVRIILRDGRA